MGRSEQTELCLGLESTAAVQPAESSGGGPAAPSLRSRAMRASVWTIVGYGGALLLRLGSNLVLTRLLFPEAFGLMALVFVIVQGMQMMSDMGIGPSIIQNQRGDERKFLNTAWTFQILRGSVIWVCLLLIMWPAAAFYADPRLMWLVPVVGLTAVVSGFDSTARFTVNRHLVLGKLTAFDLGAQILAVVVMIAWAWLSPTVWALVAGAIVRASAQMALSHRLLSGPGNQLALDRDAIRAIINFGKWIFLTSAVGFLAAQVDRLILAKLLSFERLGVYTIAFLLSNLPNDVVATLGMRVIFPAASERAHLPREDLRKLMLRNRWPFLYALAVAVALLVVFGDVLVRVLYDVRYHDASWMLTILALGLWPRVLTNTMGPALLAIGQPRYIAYSATLRFLLLCGAVPAAYHAFGLAGAVAAVAVASLVDYGVEIYGLWRHQLTPIRQDLKMTLAWIILIIAFLLARSWLGLGLPF